MLILSVYVRLTHISFAITIFYSYIYKTAEESIGKEQMKGV
jgi:hypothetical protein